MVVEYPSKALAAVLRAPRHFALAIFYAVLHSLLTLFSSLRGPPVPTRKMAAAPSESKDGDSRKDGDAWLNHAKSLTDQEIDLNTCVLVLKKKYFFSDQSVVSADATQIAILYSQSKQAILDGTHPCTHDEAMEFAALSMIIDYGEFRTDTHKPGFLQDLRSVLPAEYAKIKHIDRLVLPDGYT